LDNFKWFLQVFPDRLKKLIINSCPSAPKNKMDGMAGKEKTSSSFQTKIWCQKFSKKSALGMESSPSEDISI
jgi:hypothetical protein